MATEPAVELLYLVRRRPGLTLDEFSEHWLYPHSPLGRRDPRVLRYVQHHRLGEDPLAGLVAPPAVDPLDGVAEAAWERRETMLDYMQSPEVAEAQKDELLFIEHSRSVGFLGRRQVVVTPVGPGPVVLLELLMRVEGLTRPAFHDLLMEGLAQGPVAERLRTAASGGLLQGVVAYLSLEDEDARVEELEGSGRSAEAWDAVVLSYLNSRATLKALVADGGLPVIGAADRLGIDAAASAYVATRRIDIKASPPTG
jgi:hypothetical protein